MAIIYEIGFRADTDEVSKALGGIQRDIERAFSSATRGKGGLSKELAAGVQQARLLDQALKKATTEKGLSFTKLNAELKVANSSISQMLAAFNNAGFSESTNALLINLVKADRQMISIGQKTKDLGRVMTQSFKFSMAQETLQAIREGLSEAVTYVKELDKAMNQIQIVTGKTGDQMATVTKNAIEGARELRVAAKEYADASLIFYQQGLPDDEVKRRSDITIQAAKAAGESVKQMSEELTAVWNTYQMEGERLANAASIGAKIGAETAVDFKYIAEAMSISASAASQLGVSYESLNAIIATVGETTMQSASVVGTAYKTIFSRLSNLKLDGETEDGVKLGQITSQLAEVGINALDASGELRAIDDIIKELGNSWETYSKAQQAAIAQVVGGTRQYGQFLALMNNFDKYLTNVQSAYSETGNATLLKQYETSLDTIESKAINAGEAWKRALANAFTTDSMKGFYSLIEDLGKMTDTFLKSIGGLPGIMMLLASIFSGPLATGITKAAFGLKTMWDTRTPEKYANYLENQMTEALRRIEQQTYQSNLKRISAANPTMSNEWVKNNATKTTTEDMSYIGQQIRLTQMAQVEHERLNQIIRTGTEEQRIAASQQLTLVQNLHQAALQSIDALKANQLDMLTLVETAEQLNNRGRQEGEERTAVNETGAAYQKLLNIVKELQRQTMNGIIDKKAWKDMANSSGEIGRLGNMLGNLGKKVAGTQLELPFKRAAAAVKTLKTSSQEETVTLEQVKSVSDLIADALSRVNEQGRAFNISDREDIESLEQLNNQLREIIKNIGIIQDANTEINPLKQQQSDLAPEQERAKRIGESLATYSLSAQQAVQASINLSMNLGMLMTSFDSLWDSISSGDASFGQFLSSTVMMGMALVQVGKSIKTLTMGIAAQIVKHYESAAAKGVETGATWLLNIAEKALEGTTWGVIAAMAIFVAAIAAIALIIWGIVAAVQAWNKSQKEAAENNIKTADTLREQRTAIEDNTESIKKNEEAWKKAKASGASAEEEYETLEDSLLVLNTKLAEAGANQEKLNALMSQGLAKGDLSEYYDEVANSLENLAEKQILANRAAMSSKLYLAEKEAHDSWYGKRGIGGKSEGKASDIHRVLKQYEGGVVEEGTLTGKGGATLHLDRENPSKFLEQYRELLEIQKKLRDIGADTSDEYREITEMINDFAEAYNDVSAMASENVKLGAQQLGPLAKELNQQAIETLDLAGNYEQLTEAVTQFAQANGLGAIEANNLLTMLINQNAELAKYHKSLTLASDLAKKFVNIKNQDTTEAKAVRSARNEATLLPAQVDLEKKLTTAETNLANIQAISTAKYIERYKTVPANQKVYGHFFQAEKAAAEKAVKTAQKDLEDLSKQTKEAWQKVNDAQDKYNKSLQNDFEEEQKRIADELSKLSAKDLEIAAKIKLENVDDWEDFEKSIAAYKDFDLKINVKIDKDPLSTISESNTLQKQLGDAISEYSKDGYVSNDTAGEFARTDPEKFRRYFTETEKGFALTKEAAEAFNESIKNEEAALRDLLTIIDDVDYSLYDFGQEMNQLAFAYKNNDKHLSEFLVGMSDGIAEIINNADTAEIDKFFKTIDDGLKSVTLGNINAFEKEELITYSRALKSVNQGMATYVTKLFDAAKAGEVSQKEYRKAVTTTANETYKANQKQIEVYKKMAETDEDHATEYNEKAKKIEAANDKLKRSFDFQDTFDNLQAQADSIFNEDYTVKAGIDFESEGLDDFKTSVQSAFESLKGESEKLPLSLYSSWQQTLKTMQGISAEQRSQAAGDISAFYNGTKEIGQLSSTAVAVISKDVGAATSYMATEVNNSMDAAKEDVADFQYDVEFEPSGSISIKFPHLTDIDWMDAAKNGLKLPITMDGKMKLGIKAWDRGKGGSGGGNYIPTEFPGGSSLTGAANPNDFGNTNNSRIPRGSSGGGGGGSFKPKDAIYERDQEKKKEAKDLDELVERYENTNRLLEDNSTLLDDLANSKDRLFGPDYLIAIDKENKALQKQNELLEQQKKEAETYSKADKQKLLSAGISEELLKTNKDGSLRYQEQILQILEDRQAGQMAAYNAELDSINRQERELIERYNAAAGGMSDETYEAESQKTKWAREDLNKIWDDQQQAIEQTIKDLEKYEEANKLIAENVSKILENLRTEWNNAFEAKKVQIEWNIEINEKDLEWLEYLEEKIPEGFEGAADSLRNLSARTAELGTNMVQYYEMANEAMYDWNNLQYNAEGEIISDVNAIRENFNTAREGLLEYLSAMQESRQEMVEKYLDAIDSVRERFDDLYTSIDNTTDIIATLTDMMMESNQAYVDNNAVIHAWDARVQGSTTTLKVRNEEYQSALKREAELQAELGKMQRLGNKEMIDDVKKELKEVELWKQESKLALMEAAGQVTAVINEAMENFINVGSEKWIDGISSMFNSFEDGAELLNQKLEVDNFYMHEKDKAFEIENLIWNIEDAIEATTDPGKIKEYNAMIDELNDRKNDGAKMTEKELEILKAQFDLKLAEAAWEDARNAKNSMRLARDASGNWSYVYSQDTKDINQAERDIETKRHNIDKMWRDYEKEQSQAYYSILQEMYEFANSKNQQLYNDDKNYREWYDNMMAMYGQRLDMTAGEIEKALDATGMTLDKTALGHVLGMEKMDAANKFYQREINKWEEEVSKKYKEYQKAAEDAFEEIGWDYNDLGKTIRDESQSMTREMNKTERKSIDLAKTVDSEFAKITANAIEWRKKWVYNFEQAINVVEELIEKMQKLEKEKAGISEDQAQNAINQLSYGLSEEEQDKILYGVNDKVTSRVNQFLEARDQKLKDMGPEEAAKYDTNDDLIKLFSTFTPNEIQMMQREMALAAASEEAKKAAWIEESDGEWHGDLGVYLAKLFDAGLGHTSFYEGLKAARQAKLNTIAQYGPEGMRFWDSPEKFKEEYNKFNLYAKGGYTGNGSLSRGDHIPALLSSREYVLNPEDTRNILHATQIARDMVKAKVAGVLSNLSAQYLDTTSAVTGQHELKQKVTIEANFPNVESRTEIEAAFDNLINKAAQYVTRDN